MSASASVYTLTPPSLVECACLIAQAVGWIWLPQSAIMAAGLAEAQRLEQGPDHGLNWIGSTGFCRLHEVVACGLLLEAKQERASGHVYNIRPELRQDYPLNLSISISGGKETNKDSPSNGERTGKSPT